MFILYLYLRFTARRANRVTNKVCNFIVSIYILRFEIHIELQIHLFLAINLRIHNNKKPMHIKHPQKQILQQGILRLYNYKL